MSQEDRPGEGGGWRVEGGGLKVEGGGLKVEGGVLLLCQLFL